MKSKIKPSSHTICHSRRQNQTSCDSSDRRNTYGSVLWTTTKTIHELHEAKESGNAIQEANGAPETKNGSRGSKEDYRIRKHGDNALNPQCRPRGPHRAGGARNHTGPRTFERKAQEALYTVVRIAIYKLPPPSKQLSRQLVTTRTCIEVGNEEGREGQQGCR